MPADERATLTPREVAAAIMEKHFDGFYSDVRADIEQALKEADRLAREDARKAIGAMCAVLLVPSTDAAIMRKRINEALQLGRAAIRASITTDEG